MLQLNIQDIFLEEKNKLKQLKIEYLEIFRIFLSKTIIKQSE